MEERPWVFRIKKEYVSKLLSTAKDRAESRDITMNYLNNGLKTLFKLQIGDDLVPIKTLKSACENVGGSPSAGLYSWLDKFDNKYGAGIVEKGDKDGSVGFKIREEFYQAVKEVLTTSP